MINRTLPIGGAVLLLGWLAIGLPSLVLRAEDAPSEVTERLKADIKYLASDELEGRGVGSKGLDLAADYIRDQFARAGLDVKRVDGGAFHKFSMITDTKLGKPNVVKLTGPKGQSIELKLGSDFEVCAFGGSATVTGELVFLGYGIDAKKEHYSDLAGFDVKGKVVIVMRRVPQQAQPDSPFAAPHGGISTHAALRSKVGNAFQAGAAAILFVNDPYTNRQNAIRAHDRARDAVLQAAEEFDAVDAGDEKKLASAKEKLGVAVRRFRTAKAQAKQDPADPLMKFGYGRGGKPRPTPIVHVTHQAINPALKAALSTDLAGLEKAIDQDLKPRSAVLKGWRAELTTSITTVRTEVKNVVGVLEGKGRRANETIVIGAHYDHVGRGGPGSLAGGSTEVHNGADDNASGTVCLIELARRFAARDKPLPRRLVFIAFTAEERGLIGSARYVNNPVFPLEDTVAMFNMDMVGRLREAKLTVFGTGTAKRFKSQVTKLGKKHQFHLSMKPSGFGPSDHSSFYGKGIPVLHFFTGTHKDYHRPGDDWEKVNLEGTSQVADLVEQIVLETALKKQRPQYVEIKTRARVNRMGSRPYFGSIPDFGRDDVTGYAIQGVAPGSPAAKGGLKGGDVLVQLGSSKIAGLDDFDLALRKFRAGETVRVVVERGGKKLTLEVKLDKPR